ncbi:MAG: complex I NDUFA9 subunit family protein [Candidatus Midichloria sp.]|uniref:NADH dehydrogenase [ubiquinone] 1 alpha subcomplex subunit 9, mitochondrial n=1 Tax=Hyalomma marginatum TaxID=34627 RepID=A0A8S4C1W3_9ACAR|nr:complex I NDUFA9 subunit family protein [Hyalomma marginatum]CAG7591996.1 complex I NDUFA9 subunit family protein [Hyalomma marginatum]
MNIDENSRIVIFGGSGFVGRYVIRRLAKTNAKIIVVGRSASFRQDLSLMCSVGQISFQKVPNLEMEWQKLLVGATHVINLIGILFQTKKETFQAVHIELAEKIAHFARVNNVSKLVHISALTCKTSKSDYSISKISGERAVLNKFPEAVILRPSVIFGSEDRFLNLFAKIIRYSFFVPMVVLGKTKFQPIYVDDVAAAIEKCCNLPDSQVAGKIFEIGGEKQYSLKQLFKLIASLINKRRIFIPLPFSLSLLIAYVLQTIFPTPILTADQVKSLKKNSVVTSENALEELGVKPQNLNFILARYIK